MLRTGGTGLAEPGRNISYRNQSANLACDVLLPQVASGEKLAGQHDDGKRDEEEFEQAQAADLGLLRRVGLLGPNGLSAADFLLALLLPLEPRLVLGLLALPVLAVAARPERGPVNVTLTS